MKVKISMDYICRTILEDARNKSIKLENVNVIVPCIGSIINNKNENIREYFDIYNTDTDIIGNFPIDIKEVEKVKFFIYSDFVTKDKEFELKHVPMNCIIANPTSAKINSFSIYYREMHK